MTMETMLQKTSIKLTNELPLRNNKLRTFKKDQNLLSVTRFAWIAHSIASSNN